MALLNARQLQVLHTAADGPGKFGHPDAEIATMLSVSVLTVRSHMAAIITGLGVQDREAAIAWARSRPRD